MPKTHTILHGLHALPHWLHWVATIGSFVGLLSIGFVQPGDGQIIVTLKPKLHNFHIMEQGIYALILILVIALFAYHWMHYRIYRNLIALNMQEVAEGAIDWVRGKYYEGKYEYDLEPVTVHTPGTVNTLDLFLKHVEIAYPSGIRSKMTNEQRRDTYGKWIKGGNSAGVFLVRKRKAASTSIGRIVGFSACVIVNHAYYTRLSKGDYDGFQVGDGDLGDDPIASDGSGSRFVIMFHWYIRRGTAQRLAMNWLLVASLRHLHPPGEVRNLVLYGHTVSKEGQANYQAIGSALIGTTPGPKYPQYVLDSRIHRSERRAAANRTLARIALPIETNV